MPTIEPVAGERKYWIFTCQQCLTEYNSRTFYKFSAVSRTKGIGWKLIKRAWFCTACSSVKTDKLDVLGKLV